MIRGKCIKTCLHKLMKTFPYAMPVSTFSFVQKIIINLMINKCYMSWLHLINKAAKTNIYEHTYAPGYDD